jgi:toxin-antitoxin system PIN domain toxin
VILIDANILIYAHVSSFTQHKLAHDWLDQQLNAATSVGLPWVSLVAFLRLVTNPRVFEHPEPIGDAWRQVRTWLAAETTWIPQPTERHADLLTEFLALPGVYGNLVPDAHLAALSVEHGLTLCSTDGDFARFSGLRWLNPITSQALSQPQLNR